MLSSVDGGSRQYRDTRASDSEREATVGILATALSESRITMTGFGERTQMAYAATTRRELDVLTDDLPRILW